MFMAPFTGSISGPLQGIAWGSTDAMYKGSLALGLPEDLVSVAAGFLYMPGWVVAAIFHNVGL